MDYKNVTLNASEEEKQVRTDFAKGYMDFITENKTELDTVKSILSNAIRKGYKNYIPGNTQLDPGTKYYVNVKGKACILFSLGDLAMREGFNILCPHIDSPRIDLRPNALYNDGGLGLLKAHTYGGLKNFQWVTIPLEMRGRVYLKDNEVIDCKEAFRDYTFTITDILPHLSEDQDERKTTQSVKNEELNILVGSYEVGDEKDDDKIKSNVMKILNSIGIQDEDLTCADIEFVPKFNPELLGFDKSMVGGYGQDDRVCAYTALKAFEQANTETSSMIIFADKEEIGSEGITGANSRFWVMTLEDICHDLGLNYNNVVRKSIFVVADVNGAFDPTWESAFEKYNACYLNHGVSIQKCCGGVGKYDANETTGRTLRNMIQLFEDNDIKFQVVEMGQLDNLSGGGGTISEYSARQGFESFDIGVPILSMHSPFEVTSVFDIYETFKAYKTILEQRNGII